MPIRRRSILAFSLSLPSLFAALRSGPVLAKAPSPDKPSPQEPAITVPSGVFTEDAKPWTSLAIKDGADRFHFAVMADNTGGERHGVFEQGVAKVNLMQPAFVMSVGDFVSGPESEHDDMHEQWARFRSYIAKFDAPYFYVPGNHDIQNFSSEQQWEQRFGRPYYHFVYKDVLFLILNSEYIDFPGGPTTQFEHDSYGRNAWRASQHHADARKAMLADAQNVLDANRDVRWTFVFFHKPMWHGDWVWPPKDPVTKKRDFSGVSSTGPWPRENYDDNPAWHQLQAMLAPRNYTLLGGHTHDYAYSEETVNGHVHQRITLATTGGGSDLRGVPYGEFDEFLWVTMTDKGPVFANLVLDGVLDKDVAMPLKRPPFVK